MSPAEFQWWRAYALLKPFDWSDQWERAGLVASAAYNAAAGKLIYEPRDFVPRFTDETEAKAEQDPDDMERQLEQFFL